MESRATIWSRGHLQSMWLVERTYSLHYVMSLGLPVKAGHCQVGDDMRRYLWLPPGIDPNDLPRLNDADGNPTIYVDASDGEKPVPRCLDCGEETTHNRESSWYGHVHRFGPRDHKFRSDQ